MNRSCPKLSHGNDRLRVGVIGLGVGEQHLIGYDGNPVCRVVSACDKNAEKLRDVRARYSSVRTTTSSDDLLTDPEVDLVSIASYDDFHCDQICTALQNGKHVFVEKPLCQSFDELFTIKRQWASSAGRLKIKSNLVLRGAPLYIWARQQLKEGRFGEVYAFDGDYLFGRLAKITDGWRAKLENYSVMEGGGIHLIDLLMWLVDERPETIQTVGNRICTVGSDFSHDDYVAATLTFPSGLLARITANFGCVHGHQHVVRIFGTRGTMIHDDQGPRFQDQRDPAPPAVPIHQEPLPPSKHVLINGFVDSIVNDEDTTAETQLDFDVMSVCIASDESLRTGNTTKIQYA